MSATIRGASKPFDSADRPPLRDSENSTRERYSFRGKAGEGDNERHREGRSNLLRPKRAEGESDNEGWSTVKPRKSFGTEGAERFNGRMGLDRHREDRRFEDRRVKDREERDVKERPQRGFDTFSRDKDNDQEPERDNTRRNGLGRGGRVDSWRGGDNSDAPPTPRDRASNGERYAERSRGWREKERDDRGERGNERNERADRGDRGDRRWDRQQRHEVEPEWLDEPAEEKKTQGHTSEDFEKWRQQTRRGDEKAASSKTPAEEGTKGENGGSFFGFEKQKVETPLAIDTGPDKFFGMWATPKDENGPSSGVESKKEGVPKAQTIGKSSRFTSFFAQDEPPRRQTEPPSPMPPPPSDNGLASLFGGGGNSGNNSNSTPMEEKAAFAQLLQKLQSQQLGGSGSTPPANILQQPKPPALEKHQSNPNTNPLPTPGAESFQQYRPERQDDRQNAGSRNSQQALQDILAQRQVTTSQPTAVRPEQMLQDLVGQRQNALSQSSVRPEQAQGRNNTEFLMNLMRAAPEPQRTEQVLLRMPPQRNTDRVMQQQQQQQQMLEREQELREAEMRNRNVAQRNTRPQAPPGFFEDPNFQRGIPPHERHAGNGPQQPTQILQRPPPPGLDQMPPNWAQPQHPPPQQLRQQQQQPQHIAPPPGLAGGPTRSMPMQQMFPPGFPGIANFPPPPDGMGAPPPHRMQPPPGFFAAPPPGFLPPGMSGFQGGPPEGMPFGVPFDGRGPPPQGGFRRL